MKSKKHIWIIYLIILIPALIVGCSNKDGQLDKVSIAEVTHSVFYAPQYIAMEMGYFEEEGIEIDLIGTQGADKTMAALLSGEVQIGLMGPEASIYVYNQGSEEYAISFAQLTKRDGSFLVSREEEPDFKFEDLAGKEVLGGRKGGVPLMTLEYVLKSEGLTIGEDVASGEVNVRTDVQFAVMAGAFVGGEADYVTLFEPSATALENEGQGYIVASIGEASGEIPYTAYCALNTYIEENEDIIQRFTNAIYKGQQFAQTAPAEEIAEVIAPHFVDIDEEQLVTVVQRYQEIDAWCDTPVFNQESLERLMDVMELAGELDQRAPYETIVTTKYAEEAIK